MLPGSRRNHVLFTVLIVARLIPNADALGAVLNGGIHVVVLQVQRFVGDDYVDVVLAP